LASTFEVITLARESDRKPEWADSPLSGEFYPTRDGWFVKIELFYPRLRDAMFKVLKCALSWRAVEAAIMQWDGEALELAIREESGAIGMVRSAAEWRAHPVGRRLAAKPIIEIEKIGDSDPIPLPKGCDKALGGIRVLDCTHVIGGPITARTLAEFGADVLHISKPNYPDHLNWRLETDIGKRAAYCALLSSKTVLRKIESAEEYKVIGPWAG
jgi:crotonobetainyl-CoA:carnitine CoA-transferase CaiB-like acyl-CoA transferase